MLIHSLYFRHSFSCSVWHGHSNYHLYFILSVELIYSFNSLYFHPFCFVAFFSQVGGTLPHNGKCQHPLFFSLEKLQLWLTI